MIGNDNLVALRDPFDYFDGRGRFDWKMDKVVVMVNKPIALYGGPDLDAKKVVTIDQQKVIVKKSEMMIERDKDGASAFVFGSAKNRVYLETMDGVGGWMQVSDSVQLADGEWEHILLVFSSVNSGQ